jgi:hypothetical protein
MTEDFEYEIYVPVYDNQGSRYGEDLIQTFRSKLIEKFGGLTDTHHKNKGVWKIGANEYHDEVVVWRVLSLREGPKDFFIASLKAEMQEKLQQKQILVVRRQVTVLA